MKCRVYVIKQDVCQKTYFYGRDIALQHHAAQHIMSCQSTRNSRLHALHFP